MAAHQDSYRSEHHPSQLRRTRTLDAGETAALGQTENTQLLETTEIEECLKINTIPWEDVPSQLVTLNCRGALSA